MEMETVIAKLASKLDLKPKARTLIRLGWNYKEQGTLRVAHAMIEDEVERQVGIKQKRRLARQGVPAKAETKRIIRMQNVREGNRSGWERSKYMTEDIHKSWGTHKSVVINNKIYRKAYDEDVDWDYYPKSYGHPKITVTNKRVDQVELDPDKGQTVTASVPVERFAGDFLMKGVASILKIKNLPRKGAKERSIQLKPYYRVKKRKEINNIELWERKFAGENVDFCAVKGRTTYHAKTVRLAVVGLSKKIAKKNVKASDCVITAETGYKLGFCEEGMRDFCDVNGINFSEAIAFRDLKRIVLSNKEANLPFADELSQIRIDL